MTSLRLTHQFGDQFFLVTNKALRFPGRGYQAYSALATLKGKDFAFGFFYDLGTFWDLSDPEVPLLRVLLNQIRVALLHLGSIGPSAGFSQVIVDHLDSLKDRLLESLTPSLRLKWVSFLFYLERTQGLSPEEVLKVPLPFPKRVRSSRKVPVPLTQEPLWAPS